MRLEIKNFYRSFLFQNWKSSENNFIYDLKPLKLRFGLVSLFNGISTFVGYLMPKLFSLKNSSCTIEHIAGTIRGFIPFPRVYARKWT